MVECRLHPLLPLRLRCRAGAERQPWKVVARTLCVLPVQEVPVGVENGVTGEARLLEQLIQSPRRVHGAEADARWTVWLLPQLGGETDQLPRLVAGVLKPETRSNGGYGQ